MYSLGWKNQDQNLSLKCSLFQRRVLFLGYVKEVGVYNDHEKIVSVEAWPVPKSQILYGHYDIMTERFFNSDMIL